jgi:hypothetical protein
MDKSVGRFDEGLGVAVVTGAAVDIGSGAMGSLVLSSGTRFKGGR